MPQFTLHGHAFATCTRRVLTCVALVGAWDEVELVNHEISDTKTPEWLEIQPFAQMPYLIDHATGFVIYESRAISKYIARKVGSKYVPSETNLEALALFERASSVEEANFEEFASKLVQELIFKSKSGAETDQPKVDALKTTFAQRLEGYDRMLAKSRYVAGDKLTLADVFHLSYGTMLAESGHFPQFTDGTLPNLARWWKEVSSLPCWNKANEPLRALQAA